MAKKYAKHDDITKMKILEVKPYTPVEKMTARPVTVVLDLSDSSERKPSPPPSPPISPCQPSSACSSSHSTETSPASSPARPSPANSPVRTVKPNPECSHAPDPSRPPSPPTPVHRADVNTMTQSDFDLRNEIFGALLDSQIYLHKHIERLMLSQESFAATFRRALDSTDAINQMMMQFKD